MPRAELARDFAVLLSAGALLFWLAALLFRAATRAGGGLMRDAFFVARKDLRHALSLPQVWVWMFVMPLFSELSCRAR